MHCGNYVIASILKIRVSYPPNQQNLYLSLQQNLTLFLRLFSWGLACSHWSRNCKLYCNAYVTDSKWARHSKYRFKLYFCIFPEKTFFYLLEKFLIHVEKILFVKIKTLIIFFKKATFLRMKIFWHLLETVSKENIYNCLKQSKICIYKV